MRAGGEGYIAIVPAQATHDDLVRCWGIGAGSNGNVIREEARIARARMNENDNSGGGG